MFECERINWSSGMCEYRAYNSEDTLTSLSVMLGLGVTRGLVTCLNVKTSSLCEVFSRF